MNSFIAFQRRYINYTDLYRLAYITVLQAVCGDRTARCKHYTSCTALVKSEARKWKRCLVEMIMNNGSLFFMPEQA